MKDVREVLEVLVGQAAPTASVCWRRPADYLEHLPVVQLSRFGGPSDYLERRDRCTVDVYSEDDASDIAEAIRNALAGYAKSVEGVGLLDEVACTTLPHNVPFSDPNVEQNTAEYQVTARLHQFEE